MSCKDYKKQIVKKIADNTAVNEITKKVYYYNTIARMNNKFSLEEEKALHIIFSHIKPFNYENATTVQIEKKKFFKQLGLTGGDRWKRYRKLMSSLINKTFTELNNEKDKEIMGVVLTASRWNYKKPFFEIKLNDWFMPYIEQLKEHYTKVDLKTVCAFKSKHALTLYKFLCSWNNDKDKINHRYQSTKELKEMFGLSINDYVYNGKFRRYDFERDTVNRALNEINKKTNIIVSFKKNKNGNKVLNYEFIWTVKGKENSKSVSKQSKQVNISDLQKEQKKQNIMSKEEIKETLKTFDNWK